MFLKMLRIEVSYCRALLSLAFFTCFIWVSTAILRKSQRCGLYVRHARASIQCLLLMLGPACCFGFQISHAHTHTPPTTRPHTHRQRNKNIIFSATKFVNFIVSQIYSKCSFLIELWGHKRVERRQRLFLWTMNIMLILESTVTTTTISATTTTTSNEVTWTTNREHHRRRVINCISSFCTGHISTWGFRTSIRARFAPWSQEHLPPHPYTGSFDWRTRVPI